MAAKQNTPTLVRGVLQKLKVRIGQSGNLNMEEAYGSNSISYTLRDYNASSATFQMVGTHGKYVRKQSLRAVLRTLIKIYTFAPNFKFGTK